MPGLAWRHPERAGLRGFFPNVKFYEEGRLEETAKEKGMTSGNDILDSLSLSKGGNDEAEGVIDISPKEKAAGLATCRLDP